MFFPSLLQGVPRTIALDSNTGVNLIQLPIEEIDSLRGSKVSQTDVKLDAGAVMEVKGAAGDQVRKKEKEVQIVQRTFSHPIFHLNFLL
jgi:beta-fructofuranosidase